MSDFVKQLDEIESQQELKLLRKLRRYRHELDECYHDDAFTSTPIWISQRRHALIILINGVENELKKLQ